MAGTGAAPAENRRRRNEPMRGDWVDLDPLEAEILPKLPKGVWSERTQAAWAMWTKDAVTSQYSEADIQAAIDLAYVYEQWVTEPTGALAAEVRQRQDRLGLNPKGKRDLRWRVAVGEQTSAEPRTTRKGSSARRGRLSVVPDPS